jgi:hypothetical protein
MKQATFSGRNEMAQHIIWGCINADGSIYNGTNFTPVPGPKGTYDIVYSTPFKSTPAVVTLQNYKGWNDFSSDGGNTKDNTVLVASDRQKCKIITGDNDGKKENRNFTFLAIGEV